MFKVLFVCIVHVPYFTPLQNSVIITPLQFAALFVLAICHYAHLVTLTTSLEKKNEVSLFLLERDIRKLQLDVHSEVTFGKM